MLNIGFGKTFLWYHCPLMLTIPYSEEGRIKFRGMGEGGSPRGLGEWNPRRPKGGSRGPPPGILFQISKFLNGVF